MDNQSSPCPPVPERPAVRSPEGARVALHLGLNTLDPALRYIAAREGVWLKTTDEIAEVYREQRGIGRSAYASAGAGVDQ